MNNKIIRLILNKNKVVLVILAVSMFIVQTMNVYSADLMKRIIDSLTQSGEGHTGIISYYASIMICQVVIFFLFNYCSELAQRRAVFVMKRDFLNRYAKLWSGDSLCGNSQGEMFEIVNGDVSMVTDFSINTFIGISHTCISLVVLAVYLLLLRWDMFLMIVLIHPFLLMGQRLISPYVKKRSDDLRSSVGAIVDAMQELFSNPVDVKMSGLQGPLVKRVNERLSMNYSKDKKLMLIRSISNLLSEFMNVVAHLCVFIYGSYLVVKNEIGVGVVVVFITYTQKLISSFERLCHLTIDYSAVKPNIERLVPYYRGDENNAQQVALGENFDISFQNVSFAFNDKCNILDDVSFNFQFGKKYGIIGETGAGKSSIAKLIFGIWKLDKGKICLGNVETGKVGGNEFEKAIAYYPASPIVVHDTIFTNIALGADCVDDTKVREALEKMRLTETVNKKLSGFDAMVGSDGCMLSAGEKQRLALSRAFLSKKKIVILDEPTAFLDSATKKHVMKELYEFHSDVLMIIISHDISILQQCDEIICIDKGKMIRCYNGDRGREGKEA